MYGDPSTNSPSVRDMVLLLKGVECYPDTVDADYRVLGYRTAAGVNLDRKIAAAENQAFLLLHNPSWNGGAFRSENHNDILFVSSVELGTGYFQNFAKTLQEGFEADLDGRIGPVTWGLDYTFLSATYQSDATLDGSANNSSDSAPSGYPGLDGNIYVHPGDRIPLIPKRTGKAYALYQATKKLAFDLDEVVTSSSYVRGNEINTYALDGVYYVGPGDYPGYAVTNFLAHYDLTRYLQLAVQIDNLFDKHYYTAGQLANTGLNAQGAVVSRTFAAYTTGLFADEYPVQSTTFFAPRAPRQACLN